MSEASDPLDIVLVEFLPTGGMFQFAFQFGEALAAAGHHVTLLTGPGPELASERDGFRVRSLLPTWDPNAPTDVAGWRRKVRRAGRAVQLADSWRRVIGYVRRHRPDVVQFGELRFVLDSAALLALARLGRARAVVDVAHNPLPYDVNNESSSVEKTGRVTRGLLERAYRACDLVLVLGEGPRSDLMQHFPDVRRVAVCGHGDYSAVLAPQAAAAPSTAPPSALFFGAWTKYKQIPLLLDAFALVRAQLPEARLTLAGPVMADVDLAAISARAAAIGGVDLQPGYVAMADVPELFARHRVVMFTYETVNISGSVHMAYTFGRPVVATDVGSMRDVVADGVTGRLVASDPTQIAAAMVQILTDPALADAMGAAAGRRGRDDASWAGVAERALEAYGEVLGGRSLSGQLGR